MNGEYILVRTHNTETAHRLINYNGKCAHLHGHRYVWEVAIAGEELDERGMVMDFADIKTVIKDSIDQFDHALLLHKSDPLCNGRTDAEVAELLRATDGSSPRVWLLPFNPTAEMMAEIAAVEIDRLLKHHYPTRAIRVDHIRLWETENSHVVFCPSLVGEGTRSSQKFMEGLAVKLSDY